MQQGRNPEQVKERRKTQGGGTDRWLLQQAVPYLAQRVSGAAVHRSHAQEHPAPLVLRSSRAGPGTACWGTGGLER